jgi:hypothetical protein
VKEEGVRKGGGKEGREGMGRKGEGGGDIPTPSLNLKGSPRPRLESNSVPFKRVPT